MEEGSGSDYYDIDIDVATAAMAENVNKILGLDDETTETSRNIDNFSQIKIVDSNSGEIGGLEPCTKYALEVTAVYTNNATVKRNISTQTAQQEHLVTKMTGKRLLRLTNIQKMALCR
jgi:hypothetical protein